MRMFDPDVNILLSTTVDGSFRASKTPDPEIRDAAALQFFAKHGIDKQRAVLLRLSYDSGDFCRYREVQEDEIGAGFTKPQLVIADALVTRTPGVVLAMPLADCVGAVLYHPPTRTLMLSHLGRHNLEQFGGQKSVDFLSGYSIDPAELQVYLSPAAGKEYYPLFAFDNRSLHDVACTQLCEAGVLREQILVDDRDTVTDPDFFSHSASLRGEKPVGRHVVTCSITPSLNLL